MCFLDGLSGRTLTVPQFIFIKREDCQSAHKHLARIWKCIIALVGQFDFPFSLQNKDAHLLYNTIFKDNSPKNDYVLTLL